MQLYVKIRAAQGHCTRQVKEKPRGIVAKSGLSPFMGRGGGGVVEEDTERAPQDSAVWDGARGQGAGASPSSWAFSSLCLSCFLLLEALTF